MPKLLLFLSAVSVALSLAHASAELPKSDQGAFRRSLLAFKTQQGKWMSSLMAVRIDELPVQYAEGHIIEKNIDIAMQNLELAGKIVDQIEASADLSDEINFMSTMQELSHAMQDVATLLLKINVRDDETQRKISTWAQTLSDETNGPVNDVYVASYKFVTSRASEFERRGCAEKPTPDTK